MLFNWPKRFLNIPQCRVAILPLLLPWVIVTYFLIQVYIFFHICKSSVYYEFFAFCKRYIFILNEMHFLLINSVTDQVLT